MGHFAVDPRRVYLKGKTKEGGKTLNTFAAAG